MAREEIILKEDNRLEYLERNYRDFSEGKDLIPFQVREGESDLYIKAEQGLSLCTVRQSLIKYRRQIENYIEKYPLFKSTLLPYLEDSEAPEIIRSMIKAGNISGVGPMASVAGAIAEFVGRELLKYSSQIIIENGGDIFIKSDKIRRVSIFSGKSPFNQKIALEVESEKNYIGVCTSSGTVGPSLSYGKADAVTIVSNSVVLADAVATAAGNMVNSIDEIEKALKFVQKISGVNGAIIIKDDKIGLWGDINLAVIN